MNPEKPNYYEKSTAEKEVPEYDKEAGLLRIEELVKEKLSKSEGPIVISVAGGSASGKGFISARLKELFGDQVTYMAADDYYKGGKFVEDEAKKGHILNFDQPEALDMPQLKIDLAELKAGKTIKKPIFDFKKGEPSDQTEEVIPKKIIIADGLFVLGDDIAEQGDIKVFVEVGAHGRAIRRLLRDVERTSQKPQDILKYFAKIVEPMHQEYVESTKQNADLILHSEYNPKIESLRAGLQEKQLKFKADSISEDSIQATGAALVESVEQKDIYYNPTDRNLADTNEILRVREEISQNSETRNNARKIILTYKGPQLEDQSKTLDKPKVEFEIDEETSQSLLSLYPNRVKVIKKKRKLYELNGVQFSLDEVSKEENGQETPLGKFLELRSNKQEYDQTEIDEVLEKLGLKIEEGMKKAYAEM